MGYLVLSGIGALISISFGRLFKESFLIEPFTEPENISKAKTEPGSSSPSPLAVIISEPLPSPAKMQVDWKRFWELFTAKRELTESERHEMADLKQRLHELHRSLEEEERRRAEQLRIAIQARLSELHISDNRSEYIICRDDYKRRSDKERDYLRQHRNFLFRTYDNRCAKCGDDSNGLDIDHFFFSKNEGGCFEMIHRDGFRVNNAIALCESCNRSKSDRHYRLFFSPKELVRVMELNAKMNERLNQKTFQKWIRR